MIGRFAGLSCANVVNITSYYNGIKYSYVMYKNGSGINIDKLSEVHDDNFKNGLEVCVSIEAREYEIEAAIDKLVLFEKLHVEFINKYNGYSYSSSTCLNDHIKKFNSRKVVHYKTFSITNFLCSSQYLKVGNILYDNKSNNDLETSGGIIVNIPIGEVDITPNREELQFTDRTKKAIAYYINEVKKELQEIVNNIQSKDFTLQEFCNYCINTCIYYTNQDVTLSINKKDIIINSDACTINSNSIPSKFYDFIQAIQNIYLNPDSIYKIYNTGHYYKHRRITKTSMYFSSILDGTVHLASKKDAVTRAVTSDWFESTVGNDCVVVVYDLEEVKNLIRKYLEDGCLFSIDIINTNIDFLFSVLCTKTLANDLVPQDYIRAYKTAHKKVKKPSDSSIIPVRLYVGRYSEESTYVSTQLKALKDYVIIYSANTKEDSKLRNLANLLQPLHGIKIITLKKEDIPGIESNRRFVSLDDFLELPNNILKKVATAKIILNNFKSLSSLLGYSFTDIPIVKEFKRKYGDYIKVCETPAYYRESFIRDILDNYESRGWYNKADVEYFKINPEEEEAIKTIQKMKENKTEIIKCMAFFMFGRKDKIGLETPKINICKYLKKFKYECI